MFSDKEFNDLFHLIVSNFLKSNPSDTAYNLLELLKVFITLNNRFPVIDKRNLRSIKGYRKFFCINRHHFIEIVIDKGLINDAFRFFLDLNCDRIELIKDFVRVLVEKGWDESPVEEFDDFFKLYKSFMLIRRGEGNLVLLLSGDDIGFKYDLLYHLIREKGEFIESVKSFISKNWDSILSRIKKRGFSDLFSLYGVLCVIGDEKAEELYEILRNYKEEFNWIRVLALYFVYLCIKEKFDVLYRFLSEREEIYSLATFFASRILVDLGFHERAYSLISRIDNISLRILNLYEVAHELYLKGDYNVAFPYLKLYLDLLLKDLDEVFFEFNEVREVFPEFFTRFSPYNLIFDGIRLLMDMGKFDYALRYSRVFCNEIEDFCPIRNSIYAFIKLYQGELEAGVEYSRTNVEEIELLEFIKWYLPKDKSIQVLEILLENDPKKFNNYLLALALEYYGELTNDREKLLKYAENIVRNSKDLEEKTIALLSAIKHTKNEKLFNELKDEMIKNKDNDIILERYLISLAYIDPEQALHELKNRINEIDIFTVEALIFNIEMALSKQKTEKTNQ